MKKLILFVILISTIISGAFFIKIAPFHFYFEILNNGITSTYINLKIPKGQKSEFIIPFSMNNHQANRPTDWVLNHFNNFEFYLPLKDLNYIIVPDIQLIYKKKIFGFDILSLNKKKLVNITILEPGLFQLNYYSNKLFSLPYFKNYIIAKGTQQITKDIFSKNINIENLNSEFKISKYVSYFKHDYRELVYNLFILNFRIKNFSNAKGFSLFKRKKNNLGIIKVQSKNKYLYDDYVIFIFSKQRFERIRISIKKNDLLAKKLNTYLLNEIIYKKSSKDSAIVSYSHFKRLRFSEKISQVGTITLYNAWSHDNDNDGYLKEMIFWLEKNENNNFFILKKLYKYAFEKYGTNFSNIKKNLKETEEVRLERLVKEEQILEIEKEKKDKIQYNNQKPNDEELILYNLNKANEDQKNNSNSTQQLRVR